MTLFDDFIQSLEERTYYPMMCHKPSDIMIAKRFFDGYLTEEELSERQYIGRYWAIIDNVPGYKILYIIIDNEIVMGITYSLGNFRERIFTRKNANILLPDELLGRYYND